MSHLSIEPQDSYSFLKEKEASHAELGIGPSDMANFINLHIYHGGSFYGQPITSYNGGEVKIIEEMDLGQLSLLEFDKFLQELEYPNHARYFYKFPDEGLEKLKILLNNQDVQQMVDNRGTCNTLELYVEHELEGGDGDVDVSWMIESGDELVDEDLHNIEVDGLIKDQVNGCFSMWENVLDDEEVGNIDEKCWDSDNLEMIDDSDDDPTQKYPEFNEEIDKTEEINLEVGLKFPSIKAFKDAIMKSSIEDGRGFSYVKNDKRRVRIVCAQKCGWTIHASWSNDGQSFQIKTFENEHKCGRHYENSKFNYKWVAQIYFQEIRDNPKWEPMKMIERIKREHGLTILRWTCYRVKRKVIQTVQGDVAAQYMEILVAFVEESDMFNE